MKLTFTERSTLLEVIEASKLKASNLGFSDDDQRQLTELIESFYRMLEGADPNTGGVRIEKKIIGSKGQSLKVLAITSSQLGFFKRLFSRL